MEDSDIPLVTELGAVDHAPHENCSRCGLDWIARNARSNQLEDALHFWNAVVAAIEPPPDLGPRDLLPWIVGKIRLAKMAGAI